MLYLTYVYRIPRAWGKLRLCTFKWGKKESKMGSARRPIAPLTPLKKYSIYIFFLVLFIVCSLLRISKSLIEYVGSVSLMACGGGVLVALFHAPKTFNLPLPPCKTKFSQSMRKSSVTHLISIKPENNLVPQF